MSLWHQAHAVGPSATARGGWTGLSVSAMFFVVLRLSTDVLVCSAELSPKVDSEVAELHAFMEEGFHRIGNLTKQLQVAGGIPSIGGLPSAAVADLAGQGAASAATPSALQVAPEKIAAIRKLESDFSSLQQLAFRIGRESQDNIELVQHTDMNNYMQSLREFKPRLKDMVGDLEKELFRLTGKQADKAKKQKKPTKSIQGLAEEDIRASARKAVASDSRVFRTKAMDIVSMFRERQLLMQDRQRDMQLAMDGPDWPKEDWPISTADAKHVGEAENIIQASLRELTAKIEPSGGLPRVHESGDESVLELLTALSEMMSGYGELMDRHVSAVKKVYRSSKKRKAPKASTTSSLSGGSLRDQLLSFGGQQGTQGKPFAWLRDGQADTQAPPTGFQQPPGMGSVGGSFAKLAGISSSLGTLGGLGAGLKGFQATPAAHSTSPPLTAGGSFGAFAQPSGQPMPSRGFGDGRVPPHLSRGMEL